MLHQLASIPRRRTYLLVLLLLAFHPGAKPQTFQNFIRQLTLASASAEKDTLVARYVLRHGAPVVESTSVHFIYRGSGKTAAVPSEINGWHPFSSPMVHAEGTNFFWRTDTLPIDARIEYKLWIDSNWILDPLNPRRAKGGFGENSELRMSGYRESTADREDPKTERGAIDTLSIESAILHRRYPVYVYTPSGYTEGMLLPSIYVTDGGDYLTLGRMDIILNSLIGEKRIQPLVAVLVDPRTDPKSPSSNQRMIDYAASDAFLDFLENEVTPFIQKNYRVSPNRRDRLIMGASMGGLISTYAVLRREGFFANSAAQSPAYWQADSAVIKLLDRIKQTGGAFYIQTGTIHDTQVEARLVSRLLREKGGKVTFEEFHEGHNWTNWRSKLDRILTHFFPYP
ncbi:MAG: esterase family protein [Ignavibacteria bacterium]|nr:MAG: esterase family protein [Ignavibacteria bacterium]